MNCQVLDPAGNWLNVRMNWQQLKDSGAVFRWRTDMWMDWVVENAKFYYGE